MMADEIRQELGFSAAQALDTLRKLDQHFAKLEDRLKSTAEMMGQFNQNGAQVAQGLGQTNDGLKDASKKVQRLTVDWKTMVRIVTTQAIVRSLSTLRNALNAAVADAAEFQRKVAEVRTISPVKNLDHLKDAIQGVSDEFNVGLASTTEAFYQTLSNQVAKSVGDVESFTSSIAKFSKVAVTDIDTGVNLISGTLNAYGKDVTEAEDVSAKFFKTIELGRTRADQLANSFGTVAPLAAQLGVEMEELQAAFATVTIAGIDTNKAATQLRGVMQAFIKPSKAMKDTLRDLGYESAEQLLATKTLGEALLEVTEHTDGSTAAIAKLFPRIRGIVGELILSADGAKKFAANLDEIEKEAAEAFDREYKMFIETDVERVTRELNRLKNFFTREFGEEIIAASHQIFDVMGGADTLIRLFRSLGATIPALAASFGVFAIAMGVAEVRAWSLANAQNAAAASALSMKGAISVVGLALAAYMAGDYIGRTIRAGWDAEVEATKKAMDRLLEERKKKVARETQLEKDKVKQILKLYNEEVAETRKKYFEATDAIAVKNDALVGSTKWALRQVLDSRKKAVQAIQAAVNGMDELFDASTDRARDLKRELSDTLFARGLEQLPDQFKLGALFDRAQRESYRAAELLRKAVTEEQVQLAQQAHQRAVALNEQAYSLAQSNQEQVWANKLTEQAESMYGRMMRAERAHQSSLTTASKGLEANARDTAAWMQTLEVSAKKIEELATVFDGDKVLPAEEWQKNRATMETEIKRFYALLDEGQKHFGLEGQPFVQQLFERIAKPGKGLEFQTLVSMPANLDRVFQETQGAFQTFFDQHPFQVEIEAVAKVQGINIGDAATLMRAERAMQTSMETAPEQYQKATLALDSYNTSMATAGRLLADIGRRTEESVYMDEMGMSTEIDQRAVAFNQLRGALIGLTQGIPTQEEINRVSQLGRAFREDYLQTGWQKAFAPKMRHEVDVMAGALNRITEAYGQMGELKQNPFSQFFEGGDEAAEKARQMLPILDAIKRKAGERWQEELKSVTTQQQLNEAVDAGTNKVAAMVGQYRLLQTEIGNAARLAAPLTAPTAQTAAKGQYFAAGGRGTDVIPAWLSKGEFVVNARSAHQFFPQLQAMNAGVKPVYRESGGSVTNIGDISVTVNESKTPQLTGREVGRSLQRELRKRTLRPF